MTLTSIFEDAFDYMYNDYKQAVTLKVVSRERNDEGDITETTSSTSTYGIITNYNEDLSRQEFGLVETGDITLFLKSTETINEDDIVTIDSVDYGVKTIVSRKVNGSTIYKEIRLSKT